MLVDELINDLKGQGKEESVKIVLDFLNTNNPSKHNWSYNGNFFKVNIPFTVLDEYLDFIEGLVNCKYTLKFMLL